MQEEGSSARQVAPFGDGAAARGAPEGDQRTKGAAALSYIESSPGLCGLPDDYATPASVQTRISAAPNPEALLTPGARGGQGGGGPAGAGAAAPPPPSPTSTRTSWLSSVGPWISTRSRDHTALAASRAARPAASQTNSNCTLAWLRSTGTRPNSGGLRPWDRRPSSLRTRYGRNSACSWRCPGTCTRATSNRQPSI